VLRGAPGKFLAAGWGYHESDEEVVRVKQIRHKAQDILKEIQELGED
jgi:hypothetical protein